MGIVVEVNELEFKKVLKGCIEWVSDWSVLVVCFVGCVFVGMLVLGL